MVHFCEFCKNKIGTISECVCFAIKYQVAGTSEFGEFYVYIHEWCWGDPKFKNLNLLFKEHARKVL